MITSTFRDKASGETVRITHDKDVSLSVLKQLAMDKVIDKMQTEDNFAIDVVKGLGAGGVKALLDSAAGLQQATAIAGRGVYGEEDAMIQALGENAEKLRDLSSKVDDAIGLDEDFRYSFAGQVAQGFGQMPVQIATALGGAAVGGLAAGPVGAVAGGIAAGGGFAAGQMQTEAVRDAEQTLGKKYAEFTDLEKQQTAMSSLTYMTVGGLMEYAAVTKVIPKPLRSKLLRFASGKESLPAGEVNKAIRSLKRDAAEGALFEGMTEAAQGQLLDGLARATFDDERELMSLNVLAQRANEFAVGAIVGGGTTTAIRAGQNIVGGQPITGLKETKEVDEATRQGLQKFNVTVNRTMPNGEVKEESHIMAAPNIEAATEEANRIYKSDDTVVNQTIKVEDYKEPAVGVTPTEEGVILEESDFAEQPTVGAAQEFQFTDQDAEQALPSKERAKFNRHITEPLQRGAVRLNLNSKFQKEGVPGPLFVQTLHPITKDGRPQYGQAHSYGRSFTLRNASFSVNPLAKTQIASGVSNKFPMASVDGDVVQGRDSLEGEVLSFNPFRDDAFVDSQGRAVKSAEEVTVYGTKAYARGKIEYMDEAPEVVSREELLDLARTGRKYIHPKFHPKGTTVKLTEDDIARIQAEPTVGAAQLSADAMIDAADQVIDAPISVETDPGEGGRVRSIGKMYLLPESEVLDFNDDKNIAPAAKRISKVLDLSFKQFPKFSKWYSSRLKMAMNILQQLDPDLKKPQDQFMVKVLLAITSNGNEVSPQTEESYRIYQYWKQNNSIAVPTTQGTRVGALLNHLELVDDIIKKHGWKKLKTFMDKSGTVSDLRKEMVKTFGYTTKEASDLTGGELVAEVVPFSLMLGPKLGSFYNNLNGNFDTTTMDRWFMRTFGRTLGQQFLRQDNTKQTKRFLDAANSILADPGYASILDQRILKTQETTVRDLLPKGDQVNSSDLKRLSTFFSKKENREIDGVPIKESAPLLDNLRLATNGLFKVGDGLTMLEAPKGGKHRSFIRRVMEQSLADFNKANNLNFTPAEAQALLWYYEKLIHDSHGSRQKDEAPDYGSAANTLYRKITGRDSTRYRASDAVRRRGDVQPSGAVVSAAQQPAPPTGRRPESVGAAQPTAEQNQGFGDAVSKIEAQAQRLGVNVQARSDMTRDAQYNYETQTIEYDPARLANRGQDGAKAAMREELIHATMHKVLMNRTKGKNPRQAFEAFFSSVGKSLTQEQRAALEAVYGEQLDDTGTGAEYTRFLVQQALDGQTTEAFMRTGPAFNKVKSLIKSVQAYAARIFGKDLQQNQEAAFVIADTIKVLRNLDPDARPAQQSIVEQALEIASGNQALSSENISDPFLPYEQRERKRKMKRIKRGIRKFVQPASDFFAGIHPRIQRVLSDYYTTIERIQNESAAKIIDFQRGIAGIKNLKEQSELARLISYSPEPDDYNTSEHQELVARRDELLMKYGLYNSYNLQVRPLLDELYLQAKQSGLDINFLFDYFPRVVKDFEGLMNYYGKDVEQDFLDYVDQENKRRSAAGETLISQKEQAQLFDRYIRGKQFVQPSRIPGNLKERRTDIIPEDALQFYLPPQEALSAYTNSIAVAIETQKLLGTALRTKKRPTIVDGESIQAFNLDDPTGTLNRVVAQLVSEGALDKTKMQNLEYGLVQLFGSQNASENNLLELGRTFSYGSLLVEPTSTLSQMFDLAFTIMDNGILPALNAMFGTKVTMQSMGLDPNNLSAEYPAGSQGKKKFFNDAVRKGLQLTGFRRMDQLMKETNLTANYNRYRKTARLAPNNPKFIKFRQELEFMVGQDVDQVIADFRANKHDSELVREVLIRKLLETQPLNRFELPLSVSANPNYRMLYTMKSFLVKQLALVVRRYAQTLFAGTPLSPKASATASERVRAFRDMVKLLILFQVVGLPLDFLKDLIAGRDVYPGDYSTNALLRIAGMSKYTLYQAERGLGGAIGSYFLPVGLDQTFTTLDDIGGVLWGGKKVPDTRAVNYLPFSDVWYYRYGPGVEKQKRKRSRKLEEGIVPFLRM